jgi:hypothetical protein
MPCLRNLPARRGNRKTNGWSAPRTGKRAHFAGIAISRPSKGSGSRRRNRLRRIASIWASTSRWPILAATVRPAPARRGRGGTRPSGPEMGGSPEPGTGTQDPHPMPLTSIWAHPRGTTDRTREGAPISTGNHAMANRPYVVPHSVSGLRIKFLGGMVPLGLR